MNTKKDYKIPEVEVLELELSDIIAASGFGADAQEDPGIKRSSGYDFWGDKKK